MLGILNKKYVFETPALKAVLAAALMAATAAQAEVSTVLIPQNPAAKRPAGDLTYQGQAIDDAQAGDLLKQGVELWRLDPQESLLWKNTSLPPVNTEENHFPPEGGTVRFDSELATTFSLFRSSVDFVDAPASGPVKQSDIRPFTMTVSLRGSAAAMRSAILRRMGYQVNSPKLYRSLTLTFADVATRDLFIDHLSDGTHTDRKRWVRSTTGDKPGEVVSATLKGVVLEAGRIHVPTIYWGLMNRETQQDRRIFRSLIAPDVVADFEEKVNAFAWEPARIFNSIINLSYSYPDGFFDVSYDDLKWIVARMARLTREDFAYAVSLSGLPNDIGAVVLEKMLSRRNSLVRLAGLGDQAGILPVNTGVTIGNIVNGQLAGDPSGQYPDDPHEFYTNKPGQPPLRFSQLWRFGAIQGIAAGMGALLDQINTNLLTVASSGSAVQKHQDDVNNGVATYLAKTGSLTGYQQTAGVWGSPLLGFNVSASRTVVAGTYLGSDSQVQLVDSMSVSGNAGFFLGWDGLAPIATPSISSQVTLTRSYTHVKPVQDMDSALKTNWGHIVTAGYMMHLSKALNPDVKCSVPEGPWTSDFDVGGTKFVKIHYDQKRPKGKEEALAKRQELIKAGTSADNIVLQADDRDGNCKVEVEKAVDTNLADFAAGLAVGDTFVITDSVKLGATEAVNIPITVLAGFVDVSVGASANQGYLIQRQTMLRKTKDGFQVYLQDARMESYDFAMDFNFYINIFKISREARHGHAVTDFYNIVTDGATSDTKQKLIRSIKSLLRSNNSEILAESFEPYTLKQDLLAKIMRFKFLLWSLTNATQNLTVDIYPPVGRDGSRNRGDYKRTFFMNRMVTQTGQDWFGFAAGILTRVTGGIVNVPGAGGVGDPGNSPGGKSFTASISTQAEITPGSAFNPVTAVQQTYRGWVLSRKDAFKIFDRIEGVYGPILSARPPYTRGLFDRTQFNNTSKLELYQVDTTLMFYPEALSGVLGWLTSPDERKVFNYVMYLGGAQAKLYCENAESEFGRTAGQIYHGRGFRACAPSWVHSLMRMRKEGAPSDLRARATWLNSMMSYLINNGSITDLLKGMKAEHYFFVTRVNGFRKNDVTGALDGYMSDSVGHYDSERGAGIFRDFSTQYGISLFQLYAQFFTDGL